jgi:hypothetical protein
LDRASHAVTAIAAAAAVAAIAAVAALLAATEWSGPTTPISRRHELPAELTQTIHGAEGAIEFVQTPTKHAWVKVRQFERKLTLSRFESHPKGGPTSRQEQTFDHSFWATDVQAERSAVSGEIVSLVVAGLHDDGSATLERWKFTYHETTGTYLPLEARPLPTTERTVLFAGTTLGTIASVAIDREGRFLVVHTFESHVLWKIPLVAPFTPVALFTPETTPVLAEMGNVICTDHVTEGRQYSLTAGHRFGARGESDVTLIVRDPDNDGVFEAPVACSWAQFKALRYDLLSSYVPFTGRWH